jgi:hypothetical protein
VSLKYEDDFRSYLEKRLAIQPYLVEQGQTELKQKGDASVFNVQRRLSKSVIFNVPRYS